MAGDLHAFLNGVLEQCARAAPRRPRGVHRLSDRSGVRELMFYAIRHLTRYRYNRPVWQSMMEVRMHPLSEGPQRCFTFRLRSTRARASSRSRITSATRSITSTCRSTTASCRSWPTRWSTSSRPAPVPSVAAARRRGATCERLIDDGDHWQMLMPSHYARSYAAARRAGAGARTSTRVDGRDPLTLVHDINVGIHAPSTTSARARP